MSNKKKKVIVFTTLIALMLGYIGWMFYESEPKYINNCYKKLEKFDYVTITDEGESIYGDVNPGVVTGIVLQLDSTTAVIKCSRHYSTDYVELNLKAHRYRIIGQGTFYHKVNNYVGFNIFFITQIFIGILTAILMYTLTGLLKDLLD